MKNYSEPCGSMQPRASKLLALNVLGGAVLGLLTGYLASCLPALWSDGLAWLVLPQVLLGIAGTVTATVGARREWTRLRGRAEL